MQSTQSAPTSVPPSTQPHPTGRPRLQLSATQLVASALAAVTATIAASFLGINGTVIGAAIASVLTVAGNAIYSHSIHRTRERVRTAVPVTARRGMSDPTGPRYPTARLTITPPSAAPVRSGAVPTDGGPVEPVPAARAEHRGTTGHRLRNLGFATAGVFVAVLTLLTSVELVAGRPISDLLHGRSSAGGTTVFGARTSTAPTSTPLPATTVTQTVVPKVVTSTPTVTSTAPAVTVTPTVTATPTATPTAGPTTAPSSSGTSTATGSATP
jgi:hypothetical protein